MLSEVVWSNGQLPLDHPVFLILNQQEHVDDSVWKLVHRQHPTQVALFTQPTAGDPRETRILHDSLDVLRVQPRYSIEGRYLEFFKGLHIPETLCKPQTHAPVLGKSNSSLADAMQVSTHTP